MTATIQKSSDGYVIHLPEKIVEFINIKESEAVHVFEEHGKIVIQKSETVTIANNPTRKTIEKLFEDYDEGYEPVEIDWGKPVGKEVW